MHIALCVTGQVQKTYVSVPKPLHDEVKAFLQDLLNKGWVELSWSSYSFPVVCVRKKDGSLWLYFNWDLNQKSVPNCHAGRTERELLVFYFVPGEGIPPVLPGRGEPTTVIISWGLYQWKCI